MNVKEILTTDDLYVLYNEIEKLNIECLNMKNSPNLDRCLLRRKINLVSRKISKIMKQLNITNEEEKLMISNITNRIERILEQSKILLNAFDRIEKGYEITEEIVDDLYYSYPIDEEETKGNYSLILF